MSKTSLIIGCIVAVALHGLLWLPLMRADTDKTKAADQAPPKTKLVAAPVPKPVPDPTPVPPEPKPKPAPVKPPKKVEPKPKPPLQEVVKAPAKAKDPEPTSPDPADAVNEDDNALPPLRIVWSSAGEVRTVSRALGLRVVAMNAAGQAVGEIDAYSGRLKDFTGRLDQYSNRVRTLPRSFFGTEVASAPGRAVARFWILVPAGIDRQWMALQRSAIAQRGMTATQVREVEARFTGKAARPSLSVIRVHGNNTSKRNSDKET